MPNPQKFFLYSAGLFLLVLTVVIFASGGVITVNVNLTLPPSLEGDGVSERPSYYYSLPVPPPVEDYPRALPNPPADEFLYPPDNGKYREFDWSPSGPGNPEPKKPRSDDTIPGPPLKVETFPRGSGRLGFF